MSLFNFLFGSKPDAPVTKVECTECGALIMPSTAKENRGLCAPCAQVPKYLRDERRELKRKLADGSAFKPSEDELASARIPSDFGREGTVWTLEPEYYKDSRLKTPQQALFEATESARGNVFLVSSHSSHLDLSFNQELAVCDYQNEGNGDFLYAFTIENVQHQVKEKMQIDQCCSCCGDGLHWYPSRFHLPRKRAFEIVKEIMSNVVPNGVQWLPYDDITHIGPGKG